MRLCRGGPLQNKERTTRAVRMRDRGATILAPAAQRVVAPRKSGRDPRPSQMAADSGS